MLSLPLLLLLLNDLQNDKKITKIRKNKKYKNIFLRASSHHFINKTWNHLSQQKSISPKKNKIEVGKNLLSSKVDRYASNANLVFEGCTLGHYVKIIKHAN